MKFLILSFQNSRNRPNQLEILEGHFGLEMEKKKKKRIIRERKVQFVAFKSTFRTLEGHQKGSFGGGGHFMVSHLRLCRGLTISTLFFNSVFINSVFNESNQS